jgi:hypothetical protein
MYMPTYRFIPTNLVSQNSHMVIDRPLIDSGELLVAFIVI